MVGLSTIKPQSTRQKSDMMAEAT